MKVYSQKRSGTHLLMATLHANFVLPDMAVKVHVPGQKFATTNTAKAVVPWGNLFGSHAANTGLDLSSAIYAIRHPVYRAYSAWRFEGRGTFVAFATARLFANWKYHAESYAGAFWFRYEDMKGQRLLVRLEELRLHFGLTMQHESYQAINRPVGWSPREGQTEYDIAQRVWDVAREVLGDKCHGYAISPEPSLKI